MLNLRNFIEAPHLLLCPMLGPLLAANRALEEFVIKRGPSGSQDQHQFWEVFHHLRLLETSTSRLATGAAQIWTPDVRECLPFPFLSFVVNVEGVRGLEKDQP